MNDKKKQYSDVGIENLKIGIVEQAASDYAAAYMGCKVENKEPERAMEELERFFHSDWYLQLTSGKINGDWLMRKIKLKELDNVIDMYEKVLSLCRTFNFKVCVPKTKTEEAINFTIPPILKKDFESVVRSQLEQLKGEKEKLLKDDN